VLLFAVSFLIGIVAVAAGIGGGVLFVPIVGSLFPFHLDFVRGAGLMLALCGALSSSPRIIRGGLGEMRMVIPLSLAGSVAAMVGAHMGLLLPTKVLQTSLGVIVLIIAFIMWRAREREAGTAQARDAWADALGMHGLFRDPKTGHEVEWHARHVLSGILTFTVIGFIGGMFGLGAGWANVPALNLVMGVPLKVAVGTSSFVISPAAALVYLNKGALLPMIAAPSVAGMMLGSIIGGRVLTVVSALAIRRLVMALMLFAGLRTLGKGLGLWV
jgi:uncharacterized membrane protein YfcA